MKIVFCSNYFNHHQQPLSDCLYGFLGDQYHFIETSEISAARKKLGWGIEQYPPYVVTKNMVEESSSTVKAMINEADVVILGEAPLSMIEERCKSKKLILRYSERILKNGFEPLKYPIRWLRYHKQNPRYANIRVLCASAYTATDYAKFGMFKNKC